MSEDQRQEVIKCFDSDCLALTGQLNGRPIQSEAHPYLFNLDSVTDERRISVYGSEGSV